MTAAHYHISSKTIISLCNISKKYLKRKLYLRIYRAQCGKSWTLKTFKIKVTVWRFKKCIRNSKANKWQRERDTEKDGDFTFSTCMMGLVSALITSFTQSVRKVWATGSGGVILEMTKAVSAGGSSCASQVTHTRLAHIFAQTALSGARRCKKSVRLADSLEKTHTHTPTFSFTFHTVRPGCPCLLYEPVQITGNPFWCSTTWTPAGLFNLWSNCRWSYDLWTQMGPQLDRTRILQIFITDFLFIFFFSFGVKLSQLYIRN